MTEEDEAQLRRLGRYDIVNNLRWAKGQQEEIPSVKDKTTHNNGGSTDYYKLKTEWKDVIDIIEGREMNYSQGNILKVAMTFNVGRHGGTSYERELNKVKFFVDRELKRIKHND